MRYALIPSAGILIALAAVLLFSGVFTSQAVQAPKLSLDMDPSGNTYSDPGGAGDNSMSVGTTENCSTTAAPGNNNTHIHPVDVVIRDVEDMIGWQIRMNYDGGQMRPDSVDFAPFSDTARGQNVSFVNLPIDAGTNLHRGQLPGTNIPAPAPGPQTALVGSVYEGTQNAPISPDTPAKAVPDDTSYSAPTGGVVATLNLQVLAGNAGNPSLFINLDDASPNAPGSKAVVFTGTGQQTINIAPGALGDGYHGEGATCVPLDCVNAECPPVTPSPTPGTPTPTAPPTPPPTPTPVPGVHDVGVAGGGFRTAGRVTGVSGGPVTKDFFIKVKNFGTAVESEVRIAVTSSCSDSVDGCGPNPPSYNGFCNDIVLAPPDFVLDPGETATVTLCTATYSGPVTGSSDTYAHRLEIIHCGADNPSRCTTSDGGVDANTGNNFATTNTKVQP